MKPIITLTSDLGLKDYYVSVVKAAILNQLSDAVIIDISHLVPAFNIQQAAYIIKNAYSHFPAGSIHVIGVNTQSSPEHPHIAVKMGDHYFVGTDNGLFSLVFDRQPDLIVELDIRPDPDNWSFPMRDVFIKAACHIARGGTLEVIGKKKESFYERTMFRPVIDTDVMRGAVIYVDSYGNIITNINAQMFKDFRREKTFVIHLGRNEIDTISTSYENVEKGEILAMFNSAGFLEIAMNGGMAGNLFNVQLGDIVTITLV